MEHQINLATFGAQYEAHAGEIAWLREISQVDNCEGSWDSFKAHYKLDPAVPRPTRDREIQEWASLYGRRLFELLVDSMRDGDVRWIERLAVAVGLWHRYNSSEGNDPLRLWLVMAFRNPAKGEPQSRVWPLEKMIARWSAYSGIPVARVGERQFRRACADVGVIIGKVKVGTKKGFKKTRR